MSIFIGKMLDWVSGLQGCLLQTQMISAKTKQGATGQRSSVYNTMGIAGMLDSLSQHVRAGKMLRSSRAREKELTQDRLFSLG